MLFLSRTTLFSVPGGDTTQVLKTAEGLRELGCEVDVSTDVSPNLSGIDLVHLFNLTRPQETYLQALAAWKRQIPVVLSPIYVDFSAYDRQARTGLSGALLKHLSASMAQTAKIAGRMLFNGEYNRGTFAVLAAGYRRAQERLISMAGILLPNSQSEMRRIENDFPAVRTKPWAVVPNAVDSGIFSLQAAKPIEEFRDSVMCVGRIEGRKCQLELVRAMKGTDLKLVLIGKPAPNQLRYYDQIKQEAGRNTILLGEIPHQDLARYYASCKVHALVSWMETTGLSSLEAGVMGANLVITEEGDTRDYFGDLAHYCRPDSLASIRDAVLAAYHEPRTSALRERILERYTWRKAAEATLAAYQTLAHQSADCGLIGGAENVKGRA
ncbi:MAG: glycosyltransferase family 4 protein [Terracidiphilus sp.]